ncbi:MAG: transposase [Desulfitobacterium sp.]|nr:transposase [Desulfitobacterium sp.]
MPRKPREKSPMGIYHVIMRGVNRQIIFKDKEDRTIFLDKMFRFGEKGEYKIFAYCLMDNHIHLLLQEQEESLSTSIKRICSSYVRWYNKKYERIGHLFQERFRSEVVDNERYFLTVLRYIHQNPIKAQIITNIDEYPWSSYHQYLKDSLHIDSHNIDKKFVLTLFSSERKNALKSFREFHQEINDDNCLEIEEPQKSDETVKEIIKARFGIEPSSVKEEEKSQQIAIVSELKTIGGVSKRQISRVTGLSRRIVDRV